MGEPSGSSWRTRSGFFAIPIAFDETDFERQGERDGAFVWFTPKGDGLGLYHYAVPPDIEADLRSVDSLRTAYRRNALKVGVGVVEIETCVVDSCTAVRTLFKVAQQPTGRSYVGALTFPFQHFSYVFKVQCPELGITGVRDAVVCAKLISTGEIKIDSTSGEVLGWLDDPYDPNETGALTRNRSERREYDSQFPDHPLSRARWVLDHLQQTAAVEDAVRRQPVFTWRA
jgi:hypothetical protein